MIIRKISNSTLLFSTLIAFFLQILIETSLDNIATAFIIFVFSCILFFYLRYSKAFDTHPFSTYVIFGFCVSNIWGALIVQTLFWVPVYANLHVPITTFSTLGGFLLVAIAAHFCYRNIKITQNKTIGNSYILRPFFSWIGIYKTPPVQVLWMMGFIGVFSMLLSGGSEDSGVGGHFARGFRFLTWAPFLIPILKNREGDKYCNKRLQYLFLSFYALLILLLGVAANARTTMIEGVVDIGMIVVLWLMRTDERTSWNAITKFISISILLSTLIFPLSYFADAMVIARRDRGFVTADVMVMNTFDIMTKPYLVKQLRETDAAKVQISSYNEHYIDNALLARFIETKFHDSMFYFGDQMTESGVIDLQDNTINRMWGILPAPFLKLIGVKIDKEQMDYSVGDYITYQALGLNLGGYRTGSMFAHGLLVVGPIFYFYYFIICWISFWLMDFFSYTTKNNGTILSVLAMLNMWSFFMSGLSSDSITVQFAFIFRGFFQLVILYALIFQFLNVIYYLFSPRKSKKKA